MAHVGQELGFRLGGLICSRSFFLQLDHRLSQRLGARAHPLLQFLVERAQRPFGLVALGQTALEGEQHGIEVGDQATEFIVPVPVRDGQQLAGRRRGIQLEDALAGTHQGPDDGQIEHQAQQQAQRKRQGEDGLHLLEREGDEALADDRGVEDDLQVADVGRFLAPGHLGVFEPKPLAPQSGQQPLAKPGMVLPGRAGTLAVGQGVAEVVAQGDAGDLLEMQQARGHVDGLLGVELEGGFRRAGAHQLQVLPGGGLDAVAPVMHG